ILSQFAVELGRRFTASVLAPSFSHSAATFLSASAPPAASTTLQPAPASTLAASAPNAPVAPVTSAVLPRTSNRECGFFRMSSDMTGSPFLISPPPERERVRAGVSNLIFCASACDKPPPARFARHLPFQGEDDGVTSPARPRPR